MEEQFGFTPMATQRAVAAGKEASAVGSLIYSLLSNEKIKNISDLRGKRIGVGRVLIAAVFPLQFKVSPPLLRIQVDNRHNKCSSLWQYLWDHGVNIFSDAAQVPSSRA